MSRPHAVARVGDKNRHLGKYKCSLAWRRRGCSDPLEGQSARPPPPIYLGLGGDQTCRPLLCAPNGLQPVCIRQKYLPNRLSNRQYSDCNRFGTQSCNTPPPLPFAHPTTATAAHSVSLHGTPPVRTSTSLHRFEYCFIDWVRNPAGRKIEPSLGPDWLLQCRGERCP